MNGMNVKVPADSTNVLADIIKKLAPAGPISVLAKGTGIKYKAPAGSMNVLEKDNKVHAGPTDVPANGIKIQAPAGLTNVPANRRTSR